MVGGIVKVNDVVKHKIKREVVTIVEIKKHRAFVNWSDSSGVRFRWARLSDLEAI